MSSISDTCLVVKFSTGTWSAKKADNQAQNHISASYGNKREAAKVYKNLMQCDELDEWRQNRDAARRCLHAFTTPYLDDGERLIPMKLFDKFIEEFRQYDIKAPQLKEAFVKAYPERCKEQAKVLGRLYKETDYPPAESIASKFRFEVEFYPPRPDGQDFRAELENEYVEEIKENLTNKMQEAHSIVMGDCLQRILSCVEKWYERVADEDKILHESVMVTAVNELAEIIPSLNVDDDPDINKLAQDMKLQLGAYDLEDLRYDYDVRKKATNAARRLRDNVRQVIANKQPKSVTV